MTGTAPQIEWYIGRDGQRHGPISDDEMRKFVELGHLRPADLVWCQRFTEWKPASQVFPREPVVAPAPAAPQSPAPEVKVQPAPATMAQPVAQTSLAVAAQLADPTAAPGVVPNPATPAPRPTSAPVSQSIRPATPAASTLSDDAAWAEAMRSVLQPTAPMPAGQSSIRSPTSSPSTQFSGQPVTVDPVLRSGFAVAPTYEPIDTSPQPVPSPRLTQAEPVWEGAAPAGDDVEPPRKRRDWIAVAAGAIAVILVICGLAWITWQNRALVSGASAIGSAIKATVATTPSADSYRLSPYDAPGETREAIDAALQRTAIWRILKRDHPQWYAERVADIEQRRAQKIDEKVISKFMADVIVTLRRNNALAALQSSPEHMRQMARTFGENLRQLASRDGSTCFAFITFGEANPFSLELARTPAFAETLQRQMVSIFEAIANGKASRQIHPNTRRNDYDLLTKELSNRGWSQNDLAIFSDPSRLSASPPEKVCSLVQEWFATHIALTDTDLQARLLAESLKPLVGG